MAQVYPDGGGSGTSITVGTPSSYTVSTLGTTNRTFTCAISSTVTGRYYTVNLIVADTIIDTRSAYATSSSLNLGTYSTDSEILNTLNGAAYRNIMFQVKEYTTNGGTYIGYKNSASSNIYFNPTIYPTYPTDLGDYNLESPGTISLSWSNTHSGFRTQYRFYVNDTEVFLRSWISSSSLSYTPNSTELTTMRSLLSGAATGTLKVRREVGWNLSSGVYAMGSDSYQYDTSTISQTIYTPITVNTPTVSIQGANSIKFSFTVSNGSYSSWSYKLNSGSWILVGDSGTGVTDYLVTGLSVNTSYTVTVKATDSGNGIEYTSSASSSVTTPNIASADISVLNFTIGSNTQSVNLTNTTNGTTYTVYLQSYVSGSWTGRGSVTITATGSTATKYLTSAEYQLSNLYTDTKYSNDIQIRFLVTSPGYESYPAITSTGSAIVDATLLPSMGTTSLSEGNNSAIYGTGSQLLSNITGGFYIQNLTKFKATFASITPTTGAAIKEAKVTINDNYIINVITTEQASGALTNQIATASTAIAHAGSALDVVYSVTDTRNRTKTSSSTIKVIAYTLPTISQYDVGRVTAAGVDSPGEGTKAFYTFMPNVTVFDTTTNVGLIQNILYYKVICTSTEPDITVKAQTAVTNSSLFNTLISGYNSSTDFSISTSYTLTAYLWDSFCPNNQIIIDDILPTAIVPLSINSSGIGLMKIYEAGHGKLDVGGDIYATNGKFISSIPTGNAPLQVASTTLVSNLNADLLDGYHASSFASVNSLTNYLPLTGGSLSGNLTINGDLYLNTIKQPVIYKKKPSDPDPTMNDGDILIIYNDITSFSSTNFPQEFGTGYAWSQTGVWPNDYNYWTSMASTSNSVVESFECSTFKGSAYPNLIFDGSTDWDNNIMMPYGALPATILIKFKGSIQFNSFTLYGWAQGHETKNSPKSFAFFGSNDGHSWVSLYDTTSFTNTYNTSATANMTNTGLYFTYLKMVWRTNQNDNNTSDLTNATMISFREIKFNASGYRYV